MGFFKSLFGRGAAPAREEASADELIASLANSNAATRLNAVIELHRHPGEASASALIAALKDEDAEVRAAAAESLRLLRDPRAVPPLIEVLETDSEHTPVYNAIKALGYIRTPESISALVSALHRGKGDASALAFELGEARAAAAVEPLIRLLQNGTAYQRKQAVTALAQIKDTVALEPLERALEDSDEGVRDRVRSVTEPPAKRLWCAICGDWADASFSQVGEGPPTCARCGKQNVTEMHLPLRFRQSNQPASSSSSAKDNEFVKKNSWGIREGMSVTQVDDILAQNGFQQQSVDLPGKFGSDPVGYQYPCWRNRRSGTSVTSTFKNGKLLEFSWW